MVRRRIHPPGNPTTVEPVMRLWLLRVLVCLGGYREFIQRSCFNNDTLAEILGLGHWIGPSAGSFEPKSVLAELRQLHEQAEKQRNEATHCAHLRENIDQLSELVRLSTTDAKILEFAVSVHNELLLDDATEWLGDLSSIKVFHALSVILDVPEGEVRNSLSSAGILSRSGLVMLDRRGRSSLRSKLDLLSEGFADLMSGSRADPVGLLRGTVSPGGKAQLDLGDYNHIRPSLEILSPYLRHAIASGRHGVNVFLHGAPGTGKSQLARALAKEMGCALFEVASEDSDGDPVSGERRLRAFRAAQCFFSQQQALIAFDEVEDVFNDGNSFLGSKSTAQLRKAWINRMLEENPVPTLWMSNSVRGLDPAFIRRFDMVFELPIPPKKQRERILQDSCGDLLDAASMSRIAEAEVLAPAVVAKVGSVVRLIQDELGPQKSAAAVERLISETLEAQGHNRLVQHDPNKLPDVYDPRFIHADADLSAVATGLASARSGRLCLYGPPGTGKTAYGRWLAQQLGATLMVKRASDLKSKWLGESEKNIARAFHEAQAHGAVLLIDEVDSFLQDRRDAQRSWEVSEVNEMLTQMEAFPGVFVASTNLGHGLDQAALRRFDLKVKFDFMRSEQALELLLRHCAALHLEPPCPAEQAKLSRLHSLTPGDFAAVLRQHRFRPVTSANALIAALQSEVSVKQNSKPLMGFL